MSDRVSGIAGARVVIDKPFQGQVAVVTGASRGIGKTIALELAAERATVCLVIQVPEGRLCDQLRAEQEVRFPPP